MTTFSDSSPQLDERSLALRRQIVQTMVDGGQGHLGSALCLVEILRVLYDDVLRFDASEPNWAERDRFLLSKGHGCLAYYVQLCDKGFFPASELKNFARFDALLGGEPERRIPGVEVATGSLGHGLSLAVGFAIAARIRKESWRTMVLLGDGELNEGSIWEAALAAGKHQLDSLTVLVDYNRMQSYGPTNQVQDLEPLADKWRAFGFATAEVDGHDVAALRSTLARLPLKADRPSALICNTVKGRGIPQCENEPSWHHKSRLSPEVVAELMAALR